MGVKAINATPTKKIIMMVGRVVFITGVIEMMKNSFPHVTGENQF